MSNSKCEADNPLELHQLFQGVELGLISGDKACTKAHRLITQEKIKLLKQFIKDGCAYGHPNGDYEITMQELIKQLEKELK